MQISCFNRYSLGSKAAYVDKYVGFPYQSKKLHNLYYITTNLQTDSRLENVEISNTTF